jgi:FkbM family methyltransferase
MLSFIKEYIEVKQILSVYYYLKIRVAIKFRMNTLVRFKSRVLSTDLFIRTAGPTDYQVFKYVFIDIYHVPFRQLPAQPVILDLGSNVGFTCVHYASLFPGAKIYGYELDVNNYQVALKNINELPTIHITNKGIGYAGGVFYYESQQQSDAFQLTEAKTPTSKEVSVIPLSEVLNEKVIPYVDFMKMDIEGAEIDIFDKGDLSWLNRVTRLHMEIHSKEAISVISDKLTQFGFKVELDAHHWSAIIAYK